MRVKRERVGAETYKGLSNQLSVSVLQFLPTISPVSSYPRWPFTLFGGELIIISHIK